jgi:hypothetical protein
MGRSSEHEYKWEIELREFAFSERQLHSLRAMDWQAQKIKVALAHQILGRHSYENLLNFGGLSRKSARLAE